MGLSLRKSLRWTGTTLASEPVVDVEKGMIPAGSCSGQAVRGTTADAADTAVANAGGADWDTAVARLPAQPGAIPEVKNSSCFET